MESVFVSVGIVLLLFLVVVLYRTVIGPTSVDRMIGVNVIGTKTTILLIIIGAIFKKIDMFVDLAIAYAMLNFIASLAAARLLKKVRFTDRWVQYSGRSKSQEEGI